MHDSKDLSEASRPLTSFVTVDPESLPMGTALNYTFRYIDIASATQGRLLLPDDEIEYRDAPSRARRVLRDGDVIMSTVRPNLKAFAYCRLPPGNFIASTGFAVLRSKEGTDPRFILYSILSDDATRQIERFIVGSNYPAINSSDVKRLRISNRSPNEQEKIGEIIGTVDEAIEQTEALIAKTQQIKAGLMHDLFTRGVTADGQLRPPREEAPRLYKESPLGWIPKEWDFHAARALCSFITKGTTPPAAAFSTEDRTVRFLRVDNLTFDGTLDLSIPPLFIDPRVHRDALSRSIIRPGDVLTNIVGPPLGKVAIVPEAENGWNANQAIAIFRAVGVRAEYLKSWLLTSMAQRWLAREAKQTSGQVNLTLRMCGDLPVPLPSGDEQERINRHLSAVDESLSAEELFLWKLYRQKRGLGEDLLSGRVHVLTSVDAGIAEVAANV